MSATILDAFEYAISQGYAGTQAEFTALMSLALKYEKTTRKDLGIVTAYGYAKYKGYTGTEEQFAELMASYATVAEEAADSASEAEGYAEDSQEWSVESEAWAAGQRNGVDVDSEDETYHNNSKYYAEQAQDSADAAAESAATFTTDTGLTIAGKAADAKATGDRLAGIAAAVGSPLVITDPDDFDDAVHTRVYVYAGTTTSLYTQGDWYYWDGDGWMSGGVYNSVAVDTDDTFSIADMAADSKAVGEKFDEVDADVTDLKSALSTVQIPLTADETYENQLVRVTGLEAHTSYNSYRFEIPDGVKKIHVTTAFLGQVYVILSNQDDDATFNNYPFAQYPASGYESLTTVDVDLNTNGYKYVYVPFYKSAAVPFSVSYSYMQIVDDKVDKDGSGQISEKNTTFFELQSSTNLANVADDSITESPLTFVADNNHFVTTISTALTARVMPIFHEMVLTAGTYTLTVFADEDYATLGGGTYIGLYTGENKNVLYKYVFCTYPAGTSTTFTLENDTTVYFRFRTQDLTEANANYSAFGEIGFKMMLSKSASAVPWKDPKPKYIFKYVTDSNISFANIAMFETFGVIGDSYASGQIYLSGSPVNYYNLSWGQVLARRVGASCINLSRGGLTTKTWLESDRGLSYLQSNDAQGLYIVALGINDYTEINAGRYSLGTESDFDLSNYQSTPDTFFGNMCKIIGYVKAKSPNAKIILSTMALNNTTLRKSINDAIIRCAELANIVSVKQYEDVYFQSDYYTNGMVSGHPTAPSYSGMATAMERLIDNCMNDNYSYFYDYTWTE